jgi:enolase-phosphatase E1
MKGVDAEQVRVLLLDIEGTATPIDFVYKTLFPFASRRLEPFVRAHFGDAEIRSLVQALQTQNEADQARGLQAPAWRSDSDEALLASSVAYAQWLIEKDSKATALKSLQGKIWQEGYATGELRGEVYPDVTRAFERWRKQGRKICIYSSGSVLAQQLLFRTAASGDLTPQIAGFFDTQTGIKTSPESYKAIAAAIGHDPHEFLFLSDTPKEVEAARAAGMRAILCDRNAPVPAATSANEVIHTFDEVFPEPLS